MSWAQEHSRSERLAAEAEAASRRGQRIPAEELYRQAAAAERDALAKLPLEKVRTRGVTAVSSVALWYKGRALDEAERLAHEQMAAGSLPPFAQEQLRELLHLLWAARSAEAAGVRFVPGDVLVALKGGQILHGGAPLDLIVRQVEGIQAILFRTVEFLLKRAFRRHGPPEAMVQGMYRPWLFQAPAGSYQFAVRVQEPEQRPLWDDKPEVAQVTSTFFGILRASAADPERDLPALVPDERYRAAFLSLSRNLAPTGKSFQRLEVRDAGTPSDPGVLFGTDTRQQLNSVLRGARPPKPTSSSDVPLELRGTLRALHLDKDWLEIARPGQLPDHVRVDEAGEALDDVIGPMVNRAVTLQVVRRGSKYLYRDIELDEA